jgi:UDP-glucuronate 4-epimerase
MRVLLTGGAGFIGSHVAEASLARGDVLSIVDNFDPFYDVALKRRNLDSIARRGSVALHEVDIRDAERLKRIVQEERPDVVVHLAAKAGVRPSIAEPALYAAVNVQGTQHVLDAARLAGTPHVVFGSSSSVYGNSARRPFREDDPADQPVSPYAATKRAGELICAAAVRCGGPSVTALRFFTVFGPRQRPEMAIRLFAARILAGEELRIFGTGDTERDYTFVSDIIRGVLAATERPNDFQIYNLGGTETTKLADLVRLLGEALGMPVRLRHESEQVGDVKHTSADLSRVRDGLGWSPAVSLKDGLQLFAHWLKNEGRS